MHIHLKFKVFSTVFNSERAVKAPPLAMAAESAATPPRTENALEKTHRHNRPEMALESIVTIQGRFIPPALARFDLAQIWPVPVPSIGFQIFQSIVNRP